MKIFYWCPFIGNVATIDAVLNSIISLKKYSKKSLDPYLINAVGEWEKKLEIINSNKIKIINFYDTSILKHLPTLGFIKSRISYILIFIFTIYKLHRLLKNEKPEFIVIHLITFIPLILIYLFNYDTKFILRISGYPKLNLIRKFFWKLVSEKITLVTTPTKLTMELLKKEKIFSSVRLKYLPDPILKISTIQAKKNQNNIIENYISEQKTLISIGRLTKQKNFNFLINAFNQLQKQKKYEYLNLIILGEGEQRQKIQKLINDLKLTKKVFLLGYKNNIYDYLINSKILISTSLWEDPGFVILEAGFCNKLVLSSNCPNGPVEILNKSKNGFIYKQNSIEDFMINFDKIMNSNSSELFKKKYLLKKKCKEFTLLSHFKKFESLITNAN
tara:strand:+ start:3 stop:1166 length:1164 start_codon:yes stop_codon:yes gene_type:complete